MMLAQGHGIKKDLREGAKWAKISWERGQAEAQGLLAYILRKMSEDVDAAGDKEASYLLLLKSAELGNDTAKLRVAAANHDYDTIAQLREKARQSPIYQWLMDIEGNTGGNGT
jgi:TPR repeat protein